MASMLFIFMAITPFYGSPPTVTSRDWRTALRLNASPEAACQSSPGQRPGAGREPSLFPCPEGAHQPKPRRSGLACCNGRDAERWIALLGLRDRRHALTQAVGLG